MKRFIALLLGALFLFAGCKSSRITSDFKSENTTANNFNRVLVLGLIRDNDRQLQENMEKHMKGDLQRLGYSVITSLEEYGPRAFSGLTEEQAIAKLKNSDVDAVVTIVLLNKKMEKQFVPRSERLRPENYYQNMFWDYYGAISNRIYEPGYYFDNTEYYWESNLYEIKSRSLLYSVQTTSFNPASTESLAHQYGKMIVKSMWKKKVIIKDPEPVKKGF